jgi:hypothetical protein
VKAYKFLLPGRIALFSGIEWPEDAWVEAEGPVEPCRRGVHACRVEELPYWLADELWVIELDGEILPDELKLVAARGRLVERVEAWDEQAQREFREACARRAAMHAADELREAELEDLAAAVEAAADTAALAEAETAAAAAAYARGKVDAARLAEVAADAAIGIAGDTAAGVAYVAAHVADLRTAPTSDDPFVLERAAQARWLAQRLALSADGA